MLGTRPVIVVVELAIFTECEALDDVLDGDDIPAASAELLGCTG